MKRFLAVAMFVGTLSVAARVHAEDKPSTEPKHCPTPPAPHADNRDLFESAADKIALLKKDAGTTLSPTEQTACLLMAADLADLGGSDKEAKHLRDEAAKDQPPTGILDLLTRRQAQLDALQSQVAALRRLTHTEQQVLVDVRMIEISRTKMREAGLKLPDLNAKANGAAKDPSQAVEKSSGGAVLGIIDSDHELFAFLDELRAKGIAKTLAEPAILTVSGRAAYFNSGGEFPFLQRKSGEATIDFKQYGTQVNLVPLALGNDMLRLEFKARVSEIDEQLSINAGGLKVPGLHVRECDTGVEFASGQTVVVGGIVQPGNSTDTTRKSPENASSGKPAEPAETPQETELLVLVRARLVEPANEPLPTQPQHGYYAPSPATTAK